MVHHEHHCATGVCATSRSRCATLYGPGATPRHLQRPLMTRDMRHMMGDMGSVAQAMQQR